MAYLNTTSLRNLLAGMALTVALAGCAGSGVPTPPGTMGDAPASIMETQPIADPMSPQPVQPVQTAQQIDNATLPPASSLNQQQPQQTAAVTYQPPASRSILTFEPMVGAPKNVARELSKSLGLRVAQQALPVVPRSDASVTHRVKGYFSASQSGQNCVVSYVWDIFDANGKRINRVTGSQKTAMVGSDPWQAVTAPVLDKVAVDTAAQLKSWHASL